MSSEDAELVGPDPEGMPGEGQLNLTDPKAMRAVAHPVRLALMELLEVTPALTATQASEVLGESPANCAFHLRTLAKYGFVREAGGGKGRERPWTLAHTSISLTTTQKDEQAGLAASTLTRIWAERQLDRIRRIFSSDSWPEGWDEAAGISNKVRFLTAQETLAIQAEFQAILDRYEGRLRDPASRPEGALPVEFASYIFPLTELTELTSQAGRGSGERDSQNDNDDRQEEQ